jgi:predicted permease
LVAAQVSLAVVLLFGAGLLVRSLRQLKGLDLGYDADDVGIVEVSLDRRGRGPGETFALLAGVLDRIRTAPGVTAATWVMSRPFMGAKGVLSVRPTLEGQSEGEAEANPSFPVEVGGGQLFQTLGIPIVRGRGLLDTDLEDAPRVAVVSRAVAARLWPGEDPLGRRIEMTTRRPEWWTVVGVAEDTRFRGFREATPTIYVHYRQLQILPAVWTIAVRTTNDPDVVLPTLRELVRGIGDGQVAVWRAAALRDHINRGPLAQPRLSATLLSGFGLAAVLLAALGLYGVMALAVRERTHELGVRRALGASARRLKLDMLTEALGVTSVGTAAGLLVALFLSRLLAPLLFEVAPWDPRTMLGVCVVLLGVSLVSAYLPAWRATAVDPREALRAD